ncbi:MAG: T9SS type A sorting domain-containing protein [bacterium]|nr:T9SS type A sorting domain-containing protein [bacterium]
MKFFYLNLFAIGLLLGSNAIAQNIPFLDPIKEPEWDLTFANNPLIKIMLKSGVLIDEEKVNGTWRNRSKTEGVQDAQGNQLIFSSNDWDTVAGNWAPGDFDIDQMLSYNAQNKVTSRRMVVKQQGAPVLISNFTYTYDGSGKYLPVTIKDSINNIGTWLAINSTDSIVYGSNGKISDRIGSKSIMRNSFLSDKISFTYDGNSKLTETLLSKYNSGMWENDERHTYQYDGSGNLVAHKHDYYNDPIWEESELDSFYYSGNKIAKNVSYRYNNSAWEGNSYDEFTYTGNVVTEMTEKNWDNGSWFYTDKSVITYVNGNVSSALIYKWNDNAWETNHYRRINAASVGIKQINEQSLSIYPNPATQKIQANGNLGLNAKVSIFNISGVLVQTETLSNNTVNIENLTNGIYFLMVEYNGQVVKQRFVKN